MDDALTLLVASLGVVMVLASTPVFGLIAFLAVLLLYPDYLRVSLGTVDISACRIVITVLLVRCVADPAVMRQFHWKTLDSLVLLSMAVFAAALTLTTPLAELVENRAGFVMDTFFVYLATRMIVTDRRAFVTMSKAVAVMVVFLAAHAVMETFTGKSLYTGLGQYCPWAQTKGMEYQFRFGLRRAMGPPGETILFGLSFASLVPIIWMLRHETNGWGRAAGLLTVTAICGVAATVSSGPYLAMIVVLFCLALEYAKSLVKPAILVIILGCAAVEIISDRHFYHVVADYTMDPETGYYRARLIDVAIMKLPEYWTYGYGFKDPGWGMLINALNRTDAVNDYIVHAMVYGMFGLLAYLAVLGRSVYDAVNRYRLARSAWMQSCAWALLSSLMGLLFAFWSVSMFSQMTIQLYFLIGLHGALAVRQTAPSPALQKPFSSVRRTFLPADGAAGLSPAGR